MKAVVFTLGCKVNEVESASIMSALEKDGWQVSPELGYADIYILNTCAVTREAEKKSRQLVARAKKYNPQAEVYVCGCASQKDGAVFEQKGAVYVCGAQNKGEVVSAIAARYGGECTGLLYPKQTKTRAFIKIQDGCNNFCSYCVIPYLRGREKWRSIEDIMGEINSCTAPEIVLNGINISSYGRGEGGLCALVSALKGVKSRIRLGSLECSVITRELLKSLKELQDFAPQFHLSLQSGSNAVLRAMNRHYTREEYLNKCAMIYGAFPNAAITTDIISGFPTESEEDFLQSLSIIGEAGFARVHAFSFSAREGTAAYRLKELPPQVKNERISRLLAAAAQAERDYITKFCGKTLTFIAEEYKQPYTVGYTGNYIKLYVQGKLKSGCKYAAKIVQIHADGALAVLTDD